MKYMPRSTFIFCRNGHLVAITNRDIEYYGTYGDAFDFMLGQTVPTKGQLVNPTCYCGEDWFSISINNFTERQV
jgi:hypothetical protein